MKFGTRKWNGNLEDSIKSTNYITELDFRKKQVDYLFYAYDKRVDQLVFLQKDKMGLILFIQLEEGDVTNGY